MFSRDREETKNPIEVRLMCWVIASVVSVGAVCTKAERLERLKEQKNPGWETNERD